MDTDIPDRLIDWFRQHGRDLPWRHSRDPYAILVAEVMLQQTQVDRVVPRYLAFLDAWPDVAALAAAPTAEIIRFWSGLGYNRRAVNLQRAAQWVIAECGGAFPRDVASLRQLPGVGAYTAGAIACFAFEADVAFADTNIRRVLERQWLGEGAAGRDAAIQQLAGRVVPPGRGWWWNQAIMELGALVCTARAPACQRCPIAASCADYAQRRAAPPLIGLGGAPQRIAERRSAPFAGSRRYYRGRVLELLRAAPPGAPVAYAVLAQQLAGAAIAPPADPDWLRQLVADLARDGLLVADDAGARLP
jgi:A/G-specific adenine glycosylase